MPKQQRSSAILALEDGTIFHGRAFGAQIDQTGEACFNTSMTGYQEVATDPSYRGQIVAMTYPLIGNYGINELDNESDRPHVRGLVIGELCESPSSWRSESSLDSWLQKWNIPGIEGIDTRALTKHLRSRGAMRATLATTGLKALEAVDMAKGAPPMEGSDFVKEVTTDQAYRWDEDDQMSPDWTIPTTNEAVNLNRSNNQMWHPLPPIRHRIVAYDFGIKRNILRRFRQHGFEVHVVPARTAAADVLAMNPDGVFLSNGPGDPAALADIHAEIRKLVGTTPIFGICLGHQVLAHALGGKTFKLKFGHRGGNHPVQDLRSKKVAITSQNHGFAVDAATLPANLEVTHLNLNDQTVEGLRHKSEPIFSVQYHPEAAPGPNDATYFFQEFSNLIAENSR